MPILPKELEEKLRIVKQYKIKWDTFKEGTPDYVIQWDKEITDFYSTESKGEM